MITRSQNSFGFRTFLAAVLTALAVTVPAAPAEAGTKTWSATPADGNWNNTANWVGGVIPVNFDDLVFPANSTVKTMNNNIGGIAISSITFEGNGYAIDGLSMSVGAAGIICSTGNSPFINSVNVGIDLMNFMTVNTAAGCEVYLTGQFVVSNHGITKQGDGTLYISGNNLYQGETQIRAGRVHALSAGALGTALNGTTVDSGAALIIGASIANEALTVSGTGPGGSSSGAFYPDGNNRTWGGTVTLAAATEIGGGTGFAINGAIGGGFSLTKVGSGPLTLGAVNGFTGNTIVNGGTLLVTGNTSSSSSTSVGSEGTLGGTGTVGNPVSVSGGGGLAPGLSPGVLNTGNLSLSSGSTFTAELNSTTVGTGYDQANVTGSVSLGGATLAVNLGFSPSLGNTFTIINNDGADAVTGTFAGLAEGAIFDAGGSGFVISYVGGTGNDVVLTAAAPVPTLPSTLILMLVGVLLFWLSTTQLRRRQNQTVAS